jgi:TPR repeat protein
MRRNGLLVAGVLACALVGAMAGWNRTRPAATRPQISKESPHAEPSGAVATPLATPDTAGATVPEEAASPAAPAAGESIATRFAEAESLLPLYRELVARANKGDGEAAYYLYRIHETCAYPRNRDNSKPAGADYDANDWRTQERSRKLQRAEKACPPELQEILATQDASLWLRMAADLGYPLAQAMIASQLLDRNRDQQDLEQARRFMRTAARSRDPETLLEIARKIPALGALPGEKSVGRRADAWVLLACWNGLDCGPGSALVRSFVCNPREARSCEPTAGFEDTMQKASPARYAAAASLADQLMQAMNDGRWDELGL